MSRYCLYIFGIASTPDSLHMSDSGPGRRETERNAYSYTVHRVQ